MDEGSVIAESWMGALLLLSHGQALVLLLSSGRGSMIAESHVGALTLLLSHR